MTVLVATKDRSQQITRLLESLEYSSKIPATVIVVYAGLDVEPALSKLKTTYKLVIIKSEIASQVFQKKLGLNSLPLLCKWVLFLDDDVVVDPKTIELLFGKYLSDTNYSGYAGFGLAIKNRVVRKKSDFTNFLLSAFKLYSPRPGHVTRAGHPQSYLNHKSNFEVEWLNGISLWRKDVTKFYLEIPCIPGYAAYEDVMFSYEVSRKNKLLFTADVFVEDQLLENYKLLTTKQFIAGSYARYAFVTTRPEMSRFWLNSSQIIRNLHFVVHSKHEGTLRVRVGLTIKIWLKMVLHRFEM